MAQVRIRERRVWVGDQSRALLAGEVHYWRLDPSVWPAVLERTRELGLDMVSTYVCWDFHQVNLGEFDFTGQTHPRRDLVGFLELVRAGGFWLLLRPGPYIYAEWPNSGVPERTVQWHRLHPRFVDEARRWMRALVDAIRPYLGQPIVLVQADNEADPWIDVYGAQLGLSSTPGLYQEFLRERYRHIAELNRGWGTTYRDFAECRAVLSPSFGRFVPRYLDAVRFRHWYATQIVRWTAEEYRRLGVDVPIYANTYIDTAVQDWRALEATCDLAGPDLYPTARLAETPDEHRGVLDAVRLAHSYSALPFIPEFESGIWHGWHARVGTLTAANYELNAYSALQAGAAGWSWYMLASRDSWYMSPITELGRFRPELSATFAAIVRAFREIDPPALSKLTETAVTFNVVERGASLGNDDVLQALYRADIDYEFFDLDSGKVSKPLLLYAGDRSLSADQERALTDYVERGGSLVLFQPDVRGLCLEPVAVATATAPQRLRVHLAEGVELSSPAVLVYDDVPGEPIVAERIEPLPPTQEGGHAHVRLPIGERLIVGYVEPRGAGRVVVLGVAPVSELLIALHAWLGVRVPCRAPIGSRIQSALFGRGNECVLIVTNTAEHASNVRLRLDTDVPLRVARDLRTNVETAVADGSVVVRVPPRSGTAVQLR